MNDPKTNTPPSLNPPLRIFGSSTEGPSARVGRLGFKRPQLRSLVQHDRIARYFNRREHSFGSSLD